MDIKIAEPAAEAAGAIGYKVLESSAGKTVIDVTEHLYKETLDAVRSKTALHNIAIKAETIPLKSLEPYEKPGSESDQYLRAWSETRSVELSRPAALYTYDGFGIVKSLTMHKAGTESARISDVVLAGGANEGQTAQAYAPIGKRVIQDKVTAENPDGLEGLTFGTIWTKNVEDVRGVATRFSDGTNGFRHEANAYFGNAPADARVALERKIRLDVKAEHISSAGFFDQDAEVRNQNGLFSEGIARQLGFNVQTINWKNNILSGLDETPPSDVIPMLREIYKVHGIPEGQSQLLRSSSGRSGWLDFLLRR